MKNGHLNNKINSKVLDICKKCLMNELSKWNY